MWSLTLLSYLLHFLHTCKADCKIGGTRGRPSSAGALCSLAMHLTAQTDASPKKQTKKKTT